MEQNNSFNDRLEKIIDRLDDMNTTLVRHDENLKNHLYRTELLEKTIEKFFHELIPIQTHVSQLNGALKFIGIVSTMMGIVAAILKIANFF